MKTADTIFTFFLSNACLINRIITVDATTDLAMSQKKLSLGGLWFLKNKKFPQVLNIASYVLYTCN